MKYKINTQKCTGCRICIRKCPGAIQIGNDNKAIIIEEEKLEKCGGEAICPFGAIKKMERKQEEKEKIETELTPRQGRELWMRRGMGAGRGRGLGIGPRDGRGRGRSRGGRKW